MKPFAPEVVGFLIGSATTAFGLLVPLPGRLRFGGRRRSSKGPALVVGRRPQPVSDEEIAALRVEFERLSRSPNRWYVP